MDEAIETIDVETGEETLLLDFSEPVRRKAGVAPNGEAYEIRNLDEFGLQEEHALRAKRERFTALQQKTKLSPTESAEYKKLLHSLFDEIVIADEKTKGALNDRQRQKIVLFFTAAQLGEEAELTQAAVRLSQRGTLSTMEN